MNSYINFAIQLITSAGISSLLAAAIVWLSKSVISERLKAAIENEYSSKLETHKAQLKALSDVELEKLRSQLSLTSKEHEVRFSRMHEKRADSIAITYNLLSDLNAKLQKYLQQFEFAGIAPRAERAKQAGSAYEAFHDYITAHRIFFPKSTAESLLAIDDEMRTTYNRFAITVDMQEGRGDNDIYDKWTQIYDRLNTEIKQALSEIEDEFRRLLGGND